MTVRVWNLLFKYVHFPSFPPLGPLDRQRSRLKKERERKADSSFDVIRDEKKTTERGFIIPYYAFIFTTQTR